MKNVGIHPWLAMRPRELEEGPFPWEQYPEDFLIAPKFELVGSGAIAEDWLRRVRSEPLTGYDNWDIIATIPPASDAVRQWMDIYDENPNSTILAVLFAHALELHSHLLEYIEDDLVDIDPTQGPVSDYRRQRLLLHLRQIRSLIQTAQSLAEDIFDQLDTIGKEQAIPWTQMIERLDNDDITAWLDDVEERGSLFIDNMWSATLINDVQLSQPLPQPLYFIVETLDAMAYALLNPHIVKENASLMDMTEEEIDNWVHPLSLGEARERLDLWLNNWWLNVVRTLSFV